VGGVTKWKLRCTECGREWHMETGMDLSKLKDGRIYHYCPYCKRNTFHVILGRED
jgi:transposase-like protein